MCITIVFVMIIIAIIVIMIPRVIPTGHSRKGLCPPMEEVSAILKGRGGGGGDILLLIMVECTKTSECGRVVIFQFPLWWRC
jgi:hypothetical protein